jgi:hypothetical protein
MERQLRRITYLEVTTGRRPTVLDVHGEAFDKLKHEAKAYPQYDRGNKSDDFDALLERGFQLYGVYFVRESPSSP